MKIGSKLKRMRIQNGLTLEELASRCELTKGFLSQLERDLTSPSIATLADNQQIFYIDINEVVCDEEGNLNADYTFDQIHLLGKYNDLWKQFLLTHGA